LVCYTIFWSAYVLVRDATKSSFVEAVSTNLIATVECVLCFIFAWCLCSLCNYHLYLIANAITTNEQLKGEASPNADNWPKNFEVACCSAPVPSLLLLRGDAHTSFGTHKPLEHMEIVYHELNLIPSVATVSAEQSTGQGPETSPVLWHEEDSKLSPNASG
jgi:hypothetical protein